MEKYEYWWGKFKVGYQHLIIIRKEICDNHKYNCDIIASDECFDEDEFLFIEKINPPELLS